MPTWTLAMWRLQGQSWFVEPLRRYYEWRRIAGWRAEIHRQRLARKAPTDPLRAALHEWGDAQNDLVQYLERQEVPLTELLPWWKTRSTRTTKGKKLSIQLLNEKLARAPAVCDKRKGVVVASRDQTIKRPNSNHKSQNNQILSFGIRIGI
ncbi:hypothetical protein SARC_07907 [Sphaeroforma arctica JP610]|uniref:Uncharacterized protein n=1 Tax=Sphaeroforma arctica JP610 TaxID=667725 RepID=A0A0L0FUV0_9EUKA|nr:hypothetical protein SARC_07907 [Sphaeroforma arctica JP610]KNC79713.1 hypothetical protein SARC_07907 [Sphaeroforma arctica JP610]|eukprot:XP_014153615.1 hypothetical protein SARC_07907 [Sphaeroforma arctica JP610]